MWQAKGRQQERNTGTYDPARSGAADDGRRSKKTTPLGDREETAEASVAARGEPVMWDEV